MTHTLAFPLFAHMRLHILLDGQVKRTEERETERRKKRGMKSDTKWSGVGVTRRLGRRLRHEGVLRHIASEFRIKKRREGDGNDPERRQDRVKLIKTKP